MSGEPEAVCTPCSIVCREFPAGSASGCRGRVEGGAGVGSWDGSACVWLPHRRFQKPLEGQGRCAIIVIMILKCFSAQEAAYSIVRHNYHPPFTRLKELHENLSKMIWFPICFAELEVTLDESCPCGCGEHAADRARA